MNWKNRLTNYNFWISIVSAILLICQAFKIEFDVAYINEIATALLGLLVVIGIISDPTKISIKQILSPKEEQKKENVEAENLVNEDKNETIEEVELETQSEPENIETNIEAIPIEQENESVDNNNKDDLQAIVNKLLIELKDNNDKSKLLENDIIGLIKEIQKEDSVSTEDKDETIEEVVELEQPVKIEQIEEELTEDGNKTNVETETLFKIVND